MVDLIVSEYAYSYSDEVGGSMGYSMKIHKGLNWIGNKEKILFLSHYSNGKFVVDFGCVSYVEDIPFWMLGDKYFISKKSKLMN